MTIGAHVETTPDERVMAALAHFFGLIAALIVWATQKDKSRFLRFQALQALAFDMLFMVAYVLLTMCFLGLMFVMIMALAFSTAQAATPDQVLPGIMAGMVMPFAMVFGILPLALLAMVVRVIAAVSVATGHNFRYPLIAPRVEAFLREPAAVP